MYLSFVMCFAFMSLVTNILLLQTSATSQTQTPHFSNNTCVNSSFQDFKLFVLQISSYFSCFKGVDSFYFVILSGSKFDYVYVLFSCVLTLDVFVFSFLRIVHSFLLLKTSLTNNY